MNRIMSVPAELAQTPFIAIHAALPIRLVRPAIAAIRSKSDLGRVDVLQQVLHGHCLDVGF
jgi:hypothetical protein